MELTETLQSCRDLHKQASSLIASELAFLRQHRIALIASDIPPLAFEVAAQAKIPSVAITNFSWNWIYRAYLEEYPAFLPLIEEMEAAYRRTGCRRVGGLALRDALRIRHAGTCRQQ